MQNDKKSKKRNINNLHEILDEASSRDLPPENKKYLKSLDNRLKKSSNEAQVYRKIVAKQMGEEEDSLEPKVTIHLRDGRKKLEFPELKKEEIKPEVEAVPIVKDEKPEKMPFEDEDIFEIEKVEYTRPQFIEVKPKIIIKEEEEAPVKEKKAIGDEELTEWEPIEVEKKEEAPKEVPKPVEKIEVAPSFCSQCGAKLDVGNKFCPECGNRLIAEVEKEKKEEKKSEVVQTIEPAPTFIPVKKVEEEDGSLRWESLVAGKEGVVGVAEEEKDLIKREDKIEVFKEIKSIDDETAVLLYDNGFTTIDSLKNATLYDLTNIGGIKKKLAKKIKKEIVKSAKVMPIVMDALANGKKIEDMIREDVLSKDKEEPLPVELQTKSSEWEPIEDIETEMFDELSVEKEAGIDVFKDIKSIEDETAVLLYNNGFTTLDALTIASIKDLTKIKGIKRTTAKEIKKEIEQKVKPFDIIEEEPSEVTKEEGVTEFFEDEKSEGFEVDKKIQEHEPVEIKEDGFFEGKVEESSPVKEDETEDVFKDIPSIDEKISKLLIENGIDSVDVLKNITLKDLTKIRGIKRKVAKQIKKEVEELSRKTDSDTDITTFERVEKPLMEEETEEWESFDEKKIVESVKSEIVGFMHGDYTLYQKEIETKTGKTRKVRFFSKAEPEDGEPIELPKGFEVKENAKSGLPYLKKKK